MTEPAARYDTVLFDLDGTLTDSAPGILHSIRHALAKMGRPIPDAATLRRFVGPPLVDSFRTYCGFDAAACAEALAGFREYFATEGLFENSVYPDVPPMLAALAAAGRHLAVATAKPEVFARRILDRFGLAHRFDAVYGATLDERRTRKEEVVAWALAHAGATGRTVMVGDRADDVRGARANGLDAIGVLYGYGDAAELRGAGATQLAATPRDVVACVLGRDCAKRPFLL